MLSARQFNKSYVLSLTVAAIIFAIFHGLQVIAISICRNGATHIQITALIAVTIYEVVQLTIFLLAGGLSAYLPSMIITSFALKPNQPRAALCVVVGAMLAGIFLPIYASIPYFLLSFLPDEPGYLDRCVDYALPMTIAGAVGGYAFWRRTRGVVRNGELVLDQFS